MDNATPIEAISIEFTSDVTKALQGVEAVSRALASLSSVGNIKPTLAKRLREIGEAAQSIDDGTVNKLSKLGEAISKISDAKAPASLFKNLSKASVKELEEFTEKAGGIKYDVKPAVDPSVAAEFGKNIGTALDTVTDKEEKISEIAPPVEDLATYLSRGVTPAVQLADGLKSIVKELYEMSAVQALLPAWSGANGGANPILQGRTGALSNNALLATGDFSKMQGAEIGEYTPRPATIAEAFHNWQLYTAEVARATEETVDLSKVTDNLINKVKELATSAKGKIGGFLGAIPKNFASFMTKPRSLDNLVSGMTPFGSALGTGLKTIGKGAFMPLAKELQYVGKSAMNAAGRFTSFFGSIKRVATYRLIRAALKMITNGFKEGTSNLYEWSKQFDKTQEFAKSMDKIATAALYVKNSLGAMVAPIINALAPALDWLAEKFVGLLNTINEFFAAITGAETYTVARKVATEFKDISDGAGKAAKAVKSFTIGIDELNIIEESAGSKSGSGGDNNVAENWFKKETVSRDIADFFNEIKKKIKEGDWNGIGVLLGTKINELINKIPWGKIGTKAGKLFTAAFTLGTSLLDTIDFKGFGSNVATMINNFFKNADFSKAGEFFVTSFFSGIDFIGGFLGTLDWGSVTKSISDFFVGGMRKAAKWFKKYDWKKVGSNLYDKIKEALNGLDIVDLVGSFWDVVNGVTKAAIDFTVGFINKAGEDIGNWFYDLTEGKLPDTTLGFIIGGTGGDIVEALVEFAKKGYIPLDLNLTVKSIDTGMTGIGAFMEQIGGVGLGWDIFGKGTGEKTNPIKDFWESLKLGVGEGGTTPLGDALVTIYGQLSILGGYFDDTKVKAKKMWKQIRGEDPDIEEARQHIKDVTKELKNATPYFDEFNKGIMNLTTGGDAGGSKGIEGTVFETGKKAGTSTVEGQVAGLESMKKWAIGEVNSYFDAVFGSSDNLKDVKKDGNDVGDTFGTGIVDILAEENEQKTTGIGISSFVYKAIESSKSTSSDDIKAWCRWLQEEFGNFTADESANYKVSGGKIVSYVDDGLKDKSKIQQIIDSGKNLAKDARTGIDTGVTKKQWNSSGGYMVDGTVDGMVDASKSPATKKKIGKAVNNLYEQFNKDAGIASPSKLFAKSGYWSVAGYNKGILDNMGSTKNVMSKWVDSFSNIDAEIDISRIAMPSVGDIVDEVQGYIATTGTMTLKNDSDNMQQMYEETIIPLLSNIASETKRQADKDEKTEVVMDSRRVAESVNRQNRANGYSFIR